MLAGLGVALLCGTILFARSECACSARTAPAPHVAKPQPVRQPAPEPAQRRLLNDRGEPVALSDIAPGRNVAIVVMKGTWCPVCRAEVDRLVARAHEVWGAGGFVAVLTDHAPDRNAAYAEHTALWPVLSDHDHDVLSEWGLYRDGMDHPIPGVVFLDRDGQVTRVLRGRYPGREQDDMIIDTLRAD
jgi:peroxiredoxin